MQTTQSKVLGCEVCLVYTSNDIQKRLKHTGKIGCFEENFNFCVLFYTFIEDVNIITICCLLVSLFVTQKEK